MVTTGAKSAAEVARLFRVHRSSISRLMGRRRPRINRAYYFFCDAEASLSALSSFVLVGNDLKIVGELHVGNRVTLSEQRTKVLFAWEWLGASTL